MLHARPSPITSAQTPVAPQILLAFLALCSASIVVACSQQPAPSEEERLTRESPFSATAGTAHASHHTVIEIAPDGRMIVGTEQPVPPRSSARQVFEATFVDEAGHEQPVPVGPRIQDARFAFPPSSLVAVLDDADNLSVWDTRTGTLTPVDSHVFPGFGFDHAGRTLVYARGLGPELEAFRVDLPDGPPRQLTAGGVPVWGFAFSPDDTEIVYVDAPDGFPCLTVMPAQGGSRTRLTNRNLGPDDVRAGKPVAPYPDGRRPPLWLGSMVFVEDSSGVHAIDAFGNVVAQHPDGRDLHLDVSATRALFRDGDHMREVHR
jgi:hypothetical protein